VVIAHDDLPDLPREDLNIYLDVLKECTSSWKAADDHELVVAFPKKFQTAVVKILIDRD